MRTSNFVTVATLLRSPYYLIYALPLLFLSVLLLFAGTLLTLDRTRFLASSSNAGRIALLDRLESGIGGLAIGWVLGVHTATLIALLILNQIETAHLSAPAFLVIWLFSAIILALVCSRWKHAALAFGGILGGACTGLILAISLYPSLLARLVLTLIAVVLLTGGAFLPIVRHASLRTATSAIGAVGIIYACAILGSSATNNKFASWTNAWLHLILPHDSDPTELQWGAGISKGLTSACYFLWMIGAACDWYLKQRVGDDTDEARDNVLGSYTAAFPPETFQTSTSARIKSLWVSFKERLRSGTINTGSEKPPVYPSNSHPASVLPRFHHGPNPPPVFRPRMPGTFASDPYDSDSDSDLEEETSSRRMPDENKWTASTNYSDTTLINSEGVRRQRRVGQAFQYPQILTARPSSPHIEYGDKDAERSPELNLDRHRIEPRDDEENWRPVFLKRSDSLKSTQAEIVEVEGKDVTMTPAILPDNPSSRPASANKGPMYAPTDSPSSTPGFALDRVSRAQI